MYRMYVNFEASLPSYHSTIPAPLSNAKTRSTFVPPLHKGQEAGGAQKGQSYTVTRQCFRRVALHRFYGATGYISSSLWNYGGSRKRCDFLAGDCRRDAFASFSTTEYGYVLTASLCEIKIKAGANKGVKIRS